ncbi:hypothetical protein KBZ21_41575, partial [Streptomyces sp. A73]|nr:hypothetical protein [Streptomyces sp. A73]
SYFNGEQLVRDLGISIPPQLQGLHTVIGWPRIGVEALEQRLEQAAKKAEAVAQKLVADQGRGTVREAVRRDRQATGWARTA